MGIPQQTSIYSYFWLWVLHAYRDCILIFLLTGNDMFGYILSSSCDAYRSRWYVLMLSYCNKFAIKILCVKTVVKSSKALPLAQNDCNDAEEKTFCKKCEMYRPARAHHCRYCFLMEMSYNYIHIAWTVLATLALRWWITIALGSTIVLGYIIGNTSYFLWYHNRSVMFLLNFLVALDVYISVLCKCYLFDCAPNSLLLGYL